MSVEDVGEILNQIKKLSNQNLPENGITDDFAKKIFEKLLSHESIDATLAKRLGQYFYYYSQIDEILGKIIKSLLPELNLDLMGLNSSSDNNSFRKKVELVKSLTPNATQLKIFPLLDKINRVRNILAHSAPNKLDLKKLNGDFMKLFRDAFFVGEKYLDSIARSDGSKENLEVTVKIILSTKIFLELFVDVEVFGKKVDKPLRLFEVIRKFSSMYVRRRFSTLAFQFQTGIVSTKIPDEFKLIVEFDNIFQEIDGCIKDIFSESK